jgi:CubicO group peptidase (beta-lactamase class C family)
MHPTRPILVCLLLAACSHPAPKVSAEQQAELRDSWLVALQSDVERLAGADGFQGTVRAVHGGKVELDREFGDVRCLPLGYGRRVLATLAVASLVDEGKLHFDDRVTRVLPALRGTSIDALAVSDLLTNAANLASAKGASFEESLVAAEHLPLLASPGTRTDPGDPRPWLLVEQVVTAAGGQPFSTQVQERILQRAGTTRTSVGPTAECPQAAAGVTTALDQMRIADALRTGKLVQPRTRDELFRPRIEFAPGITAGLGFSVRTGDSGQAVGLGTSGALSAYELWFDPTSGDTVALVGSSTAKTAQSVKAAVTEFFALPPPPPRTTSSPNRTRTH